MPALQFSAIYLHKPSLDRVLGEDLTLEYGKSIVKSRQWEKQSGKETKMDAFVLGHKKYFTHSEDGELVNTYGSVEVAYLNNKTGKIERVETFKGSQSGYYFMNAIINKMYRLAGKGAYGRKERTKNIQDVPAATVERFRAEFPYMIPDA